MVIWMVWISTCSNEKFNTFIMAAVGSAVHCISSQSIRVVDFLIVLEQHFDDGLFSPSTCDLQRPSRLFIFNVD